MEKIRIKRKPLMEILEGKSVMEIENAKIASADLDMSDHGVLTYYLTLEGRSWGCNFGGIVIGNGYLGAKEFTGSDKGIEAIMRIMDTVGVERWNDLKGKYVRVYTGGWGNTINKIGNIIEDKWFDQKEFFSE